MQRLLLIIGIIVVVFMFYFGYVMGTNRIDDHRSSNNYYPSVPNHDNWLGKIRINDKDASLFVNQLRDTEIIVIRSWLKYPNPDYYFVVSNYDQITSIVQATKFRFRRSPQPIHPTYEIFFLSSHGSYMMHYEKLPKGGAVIDMRLGDVKYDKYGRIITFIPKQASTYIQAYPSPSLQHQIDRYLNMVH